MDLTRNADFPSTQQPATSFTGIARLQSLFSLGEPARVKGGLVNFNPGARTHWHTHPIGQTLIVVSGSGLVQSWGGPIRRINPGDVVFFHAGEKHWHGASPTTPMAHIAVSEPENGVSVTWMEPVTDEQYTGKVSD